jgi:hypothetical protein
MWFLSPLGLFDNGRKLHALSNVSGPLDLTSDVIVALAGKSNPHHSHLFSLSQTFRLLKRTASWKSRRDISIQPSNGAARSGAFLHSHRRWCLRYLCHIWISVYRWALCLRRVCTWPEHFMQGRTELFDDPRSAQSLQDNLADALPVMIQEFPFTSCKPLCTHFRLAQSICARIAHNFW